ncbi:hypothetical protein [Eubacterium sp. 1001713B170207_170306_E7]|uniref:hypothetical protein n=1 Tax=Eubacterium sp. 1001713B170207_170306_E7 TaxID=2787097 RepID=UPI00189A9D0F|nr:hypothetical protein [Eubacterium sp. 1001713B170207_170306_E7]
MKKINHSIIIALLLFCLSFSPQAMVMAEESSNSDQAVTQTRSENPNTGIAERIGTGAFLFLAGSGSLAGTVLLRRFHNEQLKNENRHC